MNINSYQLIFIFNQSRLSEFECLNEPIYNLLIKSLNINLLPSDEVNECAKQIRLYKKGTEVNATSWIGFDMVIMQGYLLFGVYNGLTQIKCWMWLHVLGFEDFGAMCGQLAARFLIWAHSACQSGAYASIVANSSQSNWSRSPCCIQVIYLDVCYLSLRHCIHISSWTKSK